MYDGRYFHYLPWSAERSLYREQVLEPGFTISFPAIWLTVAYGKSTITLTDVSRSLMIQDISNR